MPEGGQDASNADAAVDANPRIDTGADGPDASLIICSTSNCSGCCDSTGHCNTDGTQTAACGSGGINCVDCTFLGQTCSAGLCVQPSQSDAGDGDANACLSKLCIDPVFDCPLQGCFNGCVNFHCQ